MYSCYPDSLTGIKSPVTGFQYGSPAHHAPTFDEGIAVSETRHRVYVMQEGWGDASLNTYSAAPTWQEEGRLHRLRSMIDT
jgi:hypothetical protein